MSQSGLLQGKPAVGSAGSGTVQVTVRDAANNTAPESVQLTIRAANPPKITGPSSFSAGMEGVPYPAVTFTASGGVPPLTFVVDGSGPLPGGLVLTSSGVLSGTPAAGTHGTYSVAIRVVDSVLNWGAVSLPLTIQAAPPLAITGPTSLPPGAEGVAFRSVTFTASGGTGGYTWTATGLPSGLTMSSSGVLSGTSAVGSHGSYTVQVTVKDSSNNTNTASLLLIVVSLTFTGPYQLAPATEGVAYTPVTMTVSGGTPPYTWSALSLPSGLAVSAGGLLSGTPATGTRGSYVPQVTVRDSAGASMTAGFDLTVLPAPLAVTGPSSLPAGTEGTVYGPVTFAASGGTGGYTWSATGLPSGLFVTSTSGFMSGNPLAGSHGSYTVQVTVHDSSNASATVSLPLTIQNVPLFIYAVTSLPSATEGQSNYAVQFTAMGGTTPYTWTATGLPSGLSMVSAGVIMGTPAAGSHGSYTVQVTVKDSANGTASETLPLTIQAGPSQPVIIQPTGLGSGGEGVAYPATTFMAVNGAGGYTWSATGLPNGLTMSSAGVLSGTPAAGTHGSYTVQVTVKDSANTSTTQSFPLTIANLTYTAPYLVPATEGVAYTPVTLTASGGSAPYTWSATGLPNGMSLSSAGVFSGTPAAGSHGTCAPAITVRDSSGLSLTVFVTFTVQPPLLAVTGPSSLPTGMEGTVYGPVTFTASGGSGTGYTWSATGLPSGMSVSPGGVLSGTPAAGSHGSYTIQATVHDSAGNTASASVPVTIQVAPLTIAAPTSLPAATEGVSYLIGYFTATGGSGGYTWSATGLPNGLTMSAAGALSGTPAAGSHASYTVLVTVRDSSGASEAVSLGLTVQVAPMTIMSPPALLLGTEGVPYGPVTFASIGGTGGNTWIATGLPNGLSLSSAGILSGTPTTGSHGNYTVQATVRDSSNDTASQSFPLTIQAVSVLTILTTGIYGAVEGVAYPATTFQAAGGSGGYTWTASGLPNGLSISSAGILSGTPASGSHGSYTIQVTVKDSANNTASVSLWLSVAGLTCTFNAFQPATEGVPYQAVSLTATGGTPPYTWSATGLPNGMSVSPAGVLSGTPAAGTHGYYLVAITVRDAAGATSSPGTSITVLPAPSLSITAPSSLPAGTEGTAYGPVAFTAAGGTGTYSWTATGLPSGLSMSSAGLLSGIPAAGSHGPYSVQVTVRDSANSSTLATLSLSVQPAAVAITGPSTLAAGVEGVAYTPVTFAASGGSGGYTWTATGLPGGLSMSVAGVLSGTPNAGTHGAYTVQMTAHDSAGNTASASLPLSIQAAAPVSSLAISSPSSLPAGRETIAYSPVAFTATGGAGSYVWSATGLPAGLAMSAGGVLSGTPAAGSHGAFSVQVKVQDSSQNKAAVSLPLTVYAYPPLLGFAPPLPPGQVGVPYSFTFTASGGMAPYTWVTQYALPGGLTLTPAGLLSGTPTKAGTYSIGLMLMDAQNYGLGEAIDLTISAGAAPLAIATPVSFPNGIEQSFYSAVYFSATGGSGGYAWSATGLPPGLSISTGSTGGGSGIVNGTPAAGSHGTCSVQVTVKDSSGATASVTLPLTIAPAQILAIASPPALGPYTETAPAPAVQFAASGGTAPYSWAATGLPPGVTLSAAGILGGTLAAGSHGSYSAKVTVQDAAAQTASRTYPVTVNASPQITAPTSLPAGTVGASYGPVTFTATGGAGSNTWSATGLPPGLALSLNGVLNGVPSSGGGYTVTVRVFDFTGVTATAQFNLTIGGAPAPATLTVTCAMGSAPAQVGTAFSSVCTASGGTAPYTWSLTGGLPAGLAFNARTGAVVGPPTAAGPYSFTIVATDSATPPQTAPGPVNGTILPSSFSVTPNWLTFNSQPASAPPPQSVSVSPAGLAFQVATVASCSWLQASLQSGTSPAQISVSVNPAGLSSGTYNCNLGISAGGSSQSVFVTLVVAGSTLASSPASLSFSAKAGSAAPASQTLTVSASGGGAVAFTAASACNWLTIALSSAVTPSTLTVSVQPAGLVPSTYTCPILISAPGSVGVPQPVVTLQLNPAALTAGLLSVSLSAAQGSATSVGGSMSLTGPATSVPFSTSVSGGSWLSASQSSPATPATINFQASPTGLAAGTYSATIHVTSAGEFLPISVTLVVTPVTARVVPPSLSFHFRQGSVPAPQVVSVLTSNGSLIPFTIQATPQLTAASGPGAGNVTAGVVPGIPAGTYTDAGVTLVATGSTAWQQTVPVTIVVDPAPQTPVLSVARSSLAFSVVEGAPAAAQLLVASNQGAAWSPAASASTTTGGGWLRLSPLASSAADGAPVPISVTADPSQLSAGTAGVYTGEVVVTNPATQQSVHVPVSLTVNPLSSILLSRQGLSFSAIQGGAGVPGDTLDLLNPGLGGLSWTATASTLSGGNWLQVTPASGTVAGGTVAGIGASLNMAVLAGLAPGTYYGSVAVAAIDAASGLAAVTSPQTASVTLNVLAPARQLGPSVRPGALILNSGSPIQTVTIYNPNSAPAGYTAAAVTDDGNLWCTALPSTATVQGSAPLTIQARFSGLGAGVHSCTVQLSFSDGSSQTVSALAVVAPGASGAARRRLHPHRPGGGHARAGAAGGGAGVPGYLA